MLLHSSIPLPYFINAQTYLRQNYHICYILFRFQSFSKVPVLLLSARLPRARLRMWKILARRRRAKIFHILKKKARVRAESGEATTFEKS